MALGGAVLLGLAAASVHWIGLVVGGALVGLTRRNLGRALLAGVGFGLLTVAVTVLLTPTTLGDLLQLTRVAGLTLLVGVGLSTLGALLRGVA